MALAFILQAAAIPLVLRRRPVTPFGAVTAALLAANGSASAILAVTGQTPTRGAPAERLFLVLDGATGPLFLAVGLLSLGRLRPAAAEAWNVWRGAVVAGAGLWVAALALPALLPGGFEAFTRPNYNGLHTLPATAGLGLVALGMTLRLRGRQPSEAGTDAAAPSTIASRRQANEDLLVAIAYLPAAMSFASYFAASLLPIPWQALASDQGIPRLVGGGILLTGITGSLAALAAPGGRHWAHRGVALAVSGAALVLGLATVDTGFGGNSGVAYAWYVLVAAAAYMVRPVALAYARAPTASSWSLFALAVLALGIALGKMVEAVAFGVPFGQLHRIDLFAVALALGLFPAAWVPARRWARGHDLRGKGADAGPSADERLAAFLLERACHPARVTKQQITAATGIGENNLAATVRRLERRLGAQVPGSLVAEHVVGVRGRKEYALTAEGQQRVARMPLPSLGGLRAAPAAPA